MAFQVKRGIVKTVCTDQVEGIIKRPMLRNEIWTTESLHKYLDDLGLDYTLEEVGIINDELHTREVVEDLT